MNEQYKLLLPYIPTVPKRYTVKETLLSIKKANPKIEVLSDNKNLPEGFTGIVANSWIIEFYQNGKLHRDGDKPARIHDSYGELYWYQHGEKHRDNGPAYYNFALQEEQWYQHNKLHREGDQPAIINSRKCTWYMHDEKHRENGPAYIKGFSTHRDKEIYHIEWYFNDKLNRLDGPAVIYMDGSEEWYLEGQRHRTNGPAISHKLQSGWHEKKVYNCWSSHRLDEIRRWDTPTEEYWIYGKHVGFKELLEFASDNNLNVFDPEFVLNQIAEYYRTKAVF